jgi:hypothetical protein
MMSTTRLSLVAATSLLLVASLAFCLLPHEVAGEEPSEAARAVQVGQTDIAPVIDGVLSDACWVTASSTGPLRVVGGQPGTSGSQTEVSFLRNADQLYVALRCKGVLRAPTPEPAESATAPIEFVDLLFNSNGDHTSCYLIRLTPKESGQVACSYNEHSPPWHDRSWQPRFPFAVAHDGDSWTAEFALPFEIFCKNKTLASQFGFNVRRLSVPGQEVHIWGGSFDNPDDWGALTGLPARDQMPAPDYAMPAQDPFSSGAQWGVTTYRPPPQSRRTFLADQAQQTKDLGPGSAIASNTGEVSLELEGFLLQGEPHVAGVVWDLAVNTQSGELYVLSDPRQVREAPEIRVFDRQGQYLRTIMPFSPTLPRAAVEDLCAGTITESGGELVRPKLFETLCGSLAIYGAYWHLPQKMILAPDGDLILSNIYRGTLWRLHPDGSLPTEGWTSVYHRGRNEPFESHDWTQDFLNVQDLRNYLPFQSLHYPYFCFGPRGELYISAGQSSRLTRQYGYHWEVGQQEVKYQHELPADQRGASVWKCRLGSGVRFDIDNALGGFANPAGLAHDGSHLIVADAGHNRIQVIGPDEQVSATLTHYEHDGQRLPLHDPTALALDQDQHLYVLLGSEPRIMPAEPVERTLAAIQQDYELSAQMRSAGYRRIVKLESWRNPKLLASSDELAPDVLQFVLDTGASPTLVWVANGRGPGTLTRLQGNDLSETRSWNEPGNTLTCPRQSGNQPILNIDPETGELYVEDHSNYRLKQHGRVFRLNHEGNVLKTWPSVYFNDRGLPATSPWWLPDFQSHFRYPDEPRFIDSFFGKDGRVYRWRLAQNNVELLRFDRDGNPLPFSATGTHVLAVDFPMQVNFWHDVFQGMDVDRAGNIYYVAKSDVEPQTRPVSAYNSVSRQINVYSPDGTLKTRGLLRLDAVRSVQVDESGDLYVLHRPANRPWDFFLAISKFPAGGGEPIWSRRWHGYIGQSQVIFAPCHCILSRQHQTLDDKGYLFAAGVHSVQIIDAATGRQVGEFGSYGNFDCQGPGSLNAHPELPLGIISAMAVWKDRLFIVDVLNRRIVKCRIHYGPKPEGNGSNSAGSTED